MLNLAGKEDVDVADTVSFDGDCLDNAIDVAGLVVAVLLPLDDDGMVFLVQFPASLLQRERLKLVQFPELRRLLVLLLKELFVAGRDSLCHVLHHLGTEFLEIMEPWKLADFRQVLLELELIQQGALRPFLVKCLPSQFP